MPHTHPHTLTLTHAQQNGQEAAVVESPTQLQSIANLLSGPVEKYKVSLTNKITVCLHVVHLFFFSVVQYVPPT